jgi:Ca2+-transporting ATPase
MSPDPLVTHLSDAHARTAADVAATVDVDPAVGLSRGAAEQRFLLAGPNELERVERPSLLRIVWDGFTEPFILLLVVAGALAVALGEVRDGALVLLMVGPMVGADVITAYRSERALEALRAAAAPVARVRRGGVVEEVAASTLVAGDVVLMRVGDVVPADLRIGRSEGLTFDRSILTGESLPEPGTTAADPADAQLAERHAVAFAGTSVVGGRGEGIVVATGLRTEFGRISKALAAQERRRSPLQRELDRLVRILLVVAIGLIAVTTGLGFLRGNPVTTNLMAGVSAAIAAIPEEPPVLFAVLLGLGAYRLLRRGVLVRRLNAQETLGAVDLILTDKTGTLTQNRLALTSLRTPTGPVESEEERGRLIAAALRAEEDAWSIAGGARPGSFTRSLIAAARAAGLPDELDPAELLEGEPVSDERPYSRTRALRGGVAEELALGAPEAVLRLADDLAPDARDAWHDLVERGADAGERLLLLAGRLDAEPWRPLAVVGFADQLREGIGDSLALAAGAGIQTVVLTGDHPRTAAAIARAAGLSDDHVITGEQLESWDDARVRSELRSLDIVARATPEDKLRLVDAARATGRTVAVTGDGVNDSPALQHADVAVAMGSGSAVAREASDLILGDDSFATLMYGLREGRRIVSNVQKGLVFLVSTHVAILGFILVATIAGYSQPLLPIHILWLELFIDMLTVVSFEIEREEPEAMRQPPRPRDRPLLDNPILGRIVLAGGFSALAALAIMEMHGGGFDHARWVAYTAIVAGQAVRANANRSLTYPVLRLRPNPLLFFGGLATVVVQLLIPYVPGVADAFRATPLDATDWLIVAVVALLPAAVAEIIRWTTRRAWVA